MNAIARARQDAAELLRQNLPLLILVSAAIAVGAILVMPVPNLVVLATLAAIPALLVQVAILRDLFVGIALYLLVEYLQPGHRIPAIAAVRPAFLIAAPLLLAWVLNLVRRRVPLIINWQVKSYAVFLTLGLLSAFKAISPPMVVLALIDMTKMFLVFWVMFSVITSLERLQRLVWLYIGMHILLATVGVALFATTGERRFGDVGGSFLGDENDSAMALMVMVPYMWFMLLKTRRGLLRFVLGAGMLMSSFTILFSFSRGAFLGFMTMVIYMWSKSARKVRSGILLAMAVIALFTIMPPEYWQRIESVREYGSEGSAQGRLDAWKGGIQMMLDSPLLGCGLGNFSRTYGTAYNTISERWTAAHSMYVEFMGQLGVPGLLFILATIFLTLRTYGRVRRMTRRFRGRPEFRQLETIMLGAECGFVTYLVTTVFLNSLEYPHLWHFGAMAGFGLQVSRRLRNEATRPVPIPPTPTTRSVEEQVEAKA